MVVYLYKLFSFQGVECEITDVRTSMVVQITLLCLGIGSVVAVIKEDPQLESANFRENWIGELRKKGDLVS